MFHDPCSIIHEDRKWLIIHVYIAFVFSLPSWKHAFLYQPCIKSGIICIIYCICLTSKDTLKEIVICNIIDRFGKKMTLPHVLGFLN